jgi:hypothetical protein
MEIKFNIVDNDRVAGIVSTLYSLLAYHKRLLRLASISAVNSPENEGTART